ncbi:MAG: HAMP domain-containing histidine kinase [Actinomycetota bacterium]|nr:HAMP domain-containing histidine kinase [Actinomycetota bacterium]MDQ3679792.1 HAMP domain-containing histidine kinase [Actinomycetota bacterium]
MAGPESFRVARGSLGELFWEITEAVLICEPRRVLAWNPGAEALMGVTAAQATAEGADVQPAFGNATKQFWELVDLGTGSARLETTGGSERILDARAWPLTTGEASLTVVVLHDATTEQRHMAGLQHLNVFARELLGESSLDVLLVRIVDAAKELPRADFSALLLLREGSQDEVTNFVYNAPRELFPERLPRAVGLLAASIRSASAVRIDDIRGHPSGVGIPVEHPPIAALLAVPILLGERVAGELVVANRPERMPFDAIDEALVSELAAHAAITLSLVTAREAQEHVRETRRVLIDVALRNIRTPLTVAQDALATIRSQNDDLGDHDRNGPLEVVERALERIEALTEGSLLEEHTPAGGTPVQEMGLIDVNQLAAELGEDLGRLREDVRVEVTVEDGFSSPFWGDRRLVRELLDNIVNNAVKHSPSGDVVAVTVRLEGGSIRFDVSDHGPGIPPDEQSRIFEQFHRTAQSVADGVPGAGLGLWIARRLADLQGGTVGVSSRPGQGSTFWATFPLQPVTGTTASRPV